jgi:hypothetical protein
MTTETDYEKRFDILEKKFTQLSRQFEFLIYVGKLQKALVWCGESKDFGPGGVAEEGWNTICQPLLEDPT